MTLCASLTQTTPEGIPRPKAFHTGPNIPAGGSSASTRAPVPSQRSRTTRLSSPDGVAGRRMSHTALTLPPPTFHLCPNIPAGGSADATRATVSAVHDANPKRLPSPSWGGAGGGGHRQFEIHHARATR